MQAAAEAKEAEMQAAAKDKSMQLESRLKRALQEKHELEKTRAADVKQLKLQEKQRSDVEHAAKEVITLRVQTSQQAQELSSLKSTHHKKMAMAAEAAKELEATKETLDQKAEEADEAELLKMLDNAQQSRAHRLSIAQTEEQHTQIVAALNLQMEQTVEQMQAAAEAKEAEMQAAAEAKAAEHEQTVEQMQGAAEAKEAEMLEAVESSEEQHLEEHCKLSTKIKELTEAVAMHKEVQQMTQEIHQEEMETSKLDLSQKQEDMDVQMAKIEELQSTLVHAENELDSAKFELMNLVREKEESSDQLLDLEQRVAASEDNMIAMAGDKQQLEATVHELTEQISQAKEREQAQSDAVAAQEQVVAGLEQQITSLEEQAQQKGGLVNSLHQHLAELNHELDEKTASALKKEEALIEEKTAANNQIEQLNAEITERETALQQLQDAMDKLNQSVLSSEHQVAELQSGELARVQQAEELQQELQASQMELSTLKEEGAIAETRATAQIESLQLVCAESAANVGDLEGKLAVQNQKVARLGDKLRLFDSSIADSLLQYDNFENTLATKTTSSQGTQTNTDVSIGPGEATADRASMLELHSLRQSMLESLDERQRIFDECAAAREELAELTKQNDSNNDRFQALQEQATALQTENDTLAETNAKLVGHSNHKQKIQHHVAVKKENGELKKTVTQLQSSMHTAERRMKRYEEELKKEGSAAGHTMIDFDKEEALMESLQQERFNNQELSQLLEKVANEVIEVADSEEDTVTVSSDRRMSQCQKVGQQPQAVADLCVGKLRDLSISMDTQEREAKQLSTQIKILQDKNKLLEQRIAVLL
eukprot:TRINITY_DN3459_c0_g1_i15.p1 TRINITY_DN3459_c0_g1~~TRINITY_DN3459_c0_g1_i15.p1  ORF type:complete len:829 (-),score=419.88 TRINITY_DN3459_c0_g1_i15:289-2775(-)